MTPGRYTSCQCPERKKLPEHRNWIVFMRHRNFSAFNGYHYTPSDYSGIQCHKCGKIWRSKGKFVDVLPNGSIRIVNNG